MKFAITVPLVAAAILSAAPALAYDADWKRGRIYYRAICSSCHATTPGGVIQPNSRTKAEWAAYVEADKHNKGKEPVKKYFSKEYLDSVKANNKAADRFSSVPSDQLFQDVQLFLQRSAKDGPAPATCS
jgi:hypothetical protein